MSRNLVRPYFPIPPQDYNQSYFYEVIRSFAVYLDQMHNPGEGRHTRLVLTALPNSDQGLETGSLFERNGFIKISIADQPNLLGVSSTGAVGSVTVTT
jgi:hypothetical protein|tara:strand:+ start:2384 stop:2677 length:294 start_codon:yes stop_codon:yes gene_type:complete